MSTARHMIALLRSHVDGDDGEFLSVAMQAAAHEARLGHASVAMQLYLNSARPAAPGCFWSLLDLPARLVR